jgi:hypothetical protein
VSLFAPQQVHDIPVIQVIKPLIKLDLPILSTPEYLRTITSEIIDSKHILVVILT